MAVYTWVSDSDLARFLEPFGLGRATAFKGIAEGVENSNYFVATESGRFILTLYERRVDEADLPFFLALMRHLADAGLPVPKPVTDARGHDLHRLVGKAAALVTFLEGVSPSTPSPAQCFDAGRILAELHRATARFVPTRPNDLGPDGWRHLWREHRARASEAPLPPEALGPDGIGPILDAVAAHWPSDLPEGVGHLDLFPDNVLFDGDRVTGVIDFYFAARDFFAYDIAVTIVSWGFAEHTALDERKVRALLAGYETVRPLTQAERDALPLLAQGAALRFLLTRLADWLRQDGDALVRPKTPLEYWHKLRALRTEGLPG